MFPFRNFVVAYYIVIGFYMLINGIQGTACPPIVLIPFGGVAIVAAVYLQCEFIRLTKNNNL